MSLAVSPSPRPLSGSLEVAVQVTAGRASQRSVAVRVRLMPTSLWLGGHSTLGDAASWRAGGVVSTIFTVVAQLDLLPARSTALQARVVVPRAKEPLPQ